MLAYGLDQMLFQRELRLGIEKLHELAATNVQGGSRPAA
jgi:hypothetical protein